MVGLYMYTLVIGLKKEITKFRDKKCVLDKKLNIKLETNPFRNRDLSHPSRIRYH